MSDQHQEISGNKVRGDFTVAQVYIDRRVSPDHQQRAMRAQTALALLQGPVEALGMSAELAKAEELHERGDAEGAAAAFVAIAGALDDSGKAGPAEVMLERAAATVKEADPGKAFALYVEVAERELRRGDSGAETSARRAKEVAPSGEEWVAEGLLARAMWPEHEDHVVPVIAHAWERARGTETEVVWAAALIEVLLVLRRYDEAHDIGEEYAGTTLLPGPRLQLELDRLDAAAELGHDVEGQWAQLLTWVQGRDDDLIALTQQRRGVHLSRRQDPEAAVDAFRTAVQHWGRVDGGDEQMAEAHYAESLAWQLDGRYGWTVDGRRSLAAELHGDPRQPAAIAERLKAEGIRPMLEGERLFNAKRCLMLALTFHRRAGNLRGVFDVYDLLSRLFRQSGEGAKALSYMIAGGDSKAVKAIARAIEAWNWDEVAPALRLHGPLWERATSYCVVAEVGAAMPEEDARTLAPDLLAAAAEPVLFGPGPSLALQARRALAAIACALSESQLADARPILQQEVVGNGHADREAVRALVLLTKLGRSDEAPFLLDASLRDDANAARNAAGVVIERLRTDPELRATAVAAAESGNREALELLAYAGSLDDEPALRELCNQRVRAHLEAPAEQDPPGQIKAEMVTLDSLGQIGSCADPDLSERLFRTLVGFSLDSKQLDVSRASAARAVSNLSAAVKPELAAEAFEALLPLALGTYQSIWNEQGIVSDHPMSRFQVSLGPPSELQATTVSTVCALCAEAEINPPALVHILQTALRSDDPLLIRSALDGIRMVESLEVGPEFASYLRHPDAQVRCSALRLLVARDSAFISSADGLEAARDGSRFVRSTALALAREVPEGKVLIAELTDDADLYIRTIARREG